MKRLVSFAALLLCTNLLPAQDKAPETVRVESDVTFGKGGDKELKLDLAMPRTGDGPFPAVVCVHGGGWRGGKYKDFTNLVKTLAGSGYVAITVQYRLTPDHQFPAQIEDCKCAVRWLRANAARYKVDPERVAALGMSAGGHLVCLLGLTTSDDDLEGTGDLTPEAAKQSSRVQAVVNFFGPTDLTKGDWSETVQPLLTDFLGGTLKEKPNAYAKASPITYVRKDAAYPPFLFFHGTKDTIVGYHHSVRLADALKGVGVPARLVTMEGEGHGWSTDKFQKNLEDTLAFLDQQFKKGKP
jgi:acetyl esterase/lipase